MTTSMFRHGDRVDVTIRNAELIHAGDRTVILALPGVDVMFAVPTVTDDGGPLDAVVVADAVPDFRKGQVWRAVKYGHLFFVTQPIVIQDGRPVDGPIQLVMPNNEPVPPAEAVAIWGRMEFIVEEAYPEPQAPDPRASLLPAVEARIGDSLFTTQWEQIIGRERPASEGPGMLRLHTPSHPKGLLFADADEVWVLRSDTTVLDELDVAIPGGPPTVWAGAQIDPPPWTGFLRPDDEPQPGDKAVKAQTIDEAAPAVLADQQPPTTTTGQEPAR